MYPDLNQNSNPIPPHFTIKKYFLRIAATGVCVNWYSCVWECRLNTRKQSRWPDTDRDRLQPGHRDILSCCDAWPTCSSQVCITLEVLVKQRGEKSDWSQKQGDTVPWHMASGMPPLSVLMSFLKPQRRQWALSLSASIPFTALTGTVMCHKGSDTFI